MAAKDATFDTGELLEMILFELPTKDLLFANRVCRSWKAAIKSSKKLQRALFYVTDDVWKIEYEITKPGACVKKVSYSTSTGTKPELSPIANPLLDMKPRRMVISGRGIEGLNILPSGGLSGASCLDMFITQPAVKNVKMTCPDQRPYGLSSRVIVDLAVETGITLGDMLAFLDSIGVKNVALDNVVIVGKHWHYPGEWRGFGHNSELEQFGKTSK